MTKIAILMPTYNGSKHIEQAIASVIAAHPQKYGIHALYISDDHSQDETTTLIQNNWDGNVPLILNTTPQNQGLYGNHNVGLRQMVEDGIEWAFIIHQDDYVKPNWLETIVPKIRSADSKVASICCSYDSFWNDGKIAQGETKEESEIVVPPLPESMSSTLLRGCWWHISGAAVRLSTFLEIGYFDASLPHWADWDWTLRCFAQGRSILYVPLSLTGWRQHKDSYSSHSMRTVGYAEQQIKVLERYKYVLSRHEYVRWHTQQMVFALRRTLRALQLRKVEFVKHGIRTLLLLGKNALANSW